MEKQEVNIVDLIIFSANLLLCSGIKNVNLIQLFYSAPVLSYPVVLRMLESVNYFIVLKMFTKNFQKNTNKQTKYKRDNFSKKKKKLKQIRENSDPV